MIELLEQCVRIPSLSGQEQAVAEFLRAQMVARGFDHAFVDAAGNAAGIIGAGPRQLVMLGHMDTVGGNVPVRYENGALFGRGTVDAKGPLCAFILAAAAIKSALPLNSDWQIIVIGATEEEAASSRGARHAATQYKPAVCIIGEPSGRDGITLGYKGRLLVEARFEQSSRHTAMPGPSAGEQAVRLWNWTDDFARRFNTDKPKAFDQIMPSLRHICSGDDGLREWCDLLIGLRLPLEMSPWEMQRAFEEWSSEERGGEGERGREGAEEQQVALSLPHPLTPSPQLPLSPAPLLAFKGHELAYRSAKDSALARAFVDAIRAEGMRPAFKLKTGTADFNVVGPLWQCPIVAYGPGDSKLDHTPDEHVGVEEFEQSVRVLERVLRNLMSV
ncbi:MAG: M20/M25/M40 family metallo-hydrolase [Chloroflexi bacterium]|nr:M20/M25/M40 family metallo-hydrolase [Chloroflexota bacterium]